MLKPFLNSFYDFYGWVGNAEAFALSIGIIISTVFLVVGVGVVSMHVHLVVLLMMLEVLLVAVSLSLATLGVLWLGSVGFIFTYLLLIVAGGESALALAIVTAYFFVEQRVEVEFVTKLKG